MRRLLPLSLLVSSLGLIAGCQRITEADQQAAIECVRANLVAMQKGDSVAAMATIHPKSPSYEGTENVLKAAGQAEKLTYELEKAEIDRATTSGILVKFVQVVRKTEEDDDFRDTRLEGTHLLQRDGKAWKIWSTQVQSSRIIDTPAPTPAAPPLAKPATPAPPAAASTPSQPAPLK